MSESNSSGAAPHRDLPSPAKVEANRRNGPKSHGPATERGKGVASGNALKYGLTSTRLVIERIDGEGAQERFAALHEGLREHFAPHGDPIAEFRVKRVAANLWRLQRHDRAEAAMLEEASLRAAQDDLLLRLQLPGIVDEHIPGAAVAIEPKSHRLRLLIDRLGEFEEEIRRDGGLSAESLRELMKNFGTSDPFAVECAVLCVNAMAADPGPNGQSDTHPPGAVANHVGQAARLVSEKRQQLSELQPRLEHLEQLQRVAHLTTLCVPSAMNLEKLGRSRAAINKELEQDLARLRDRPHRRGSNRKAI